MLTGVSDLNGQFGQFSLKDGFLFMGARRRLRLLSLSVFLHNTSDISAGKTEHSHREQCSLLHGVDLHWHNNRPLAQAIYRTRYRSFDAVFCFKII